ncbi:MAG: hypothetical protein SFW09_02865 [Hyphomicrobiaceae bacterium]|nr:hypothetical protein [Hyphomicrobiaceae bacterium]
MTAGLDDLLAGTPLLPLLMRMGIVAMLVVTIALVAERLGPFLGAMVASLPLNTGPIYVLLALEHDAAYFARMTVPSAAICGAIPVFVLVYAMLAPTQSALVSVLGAMIAWSALAAAVQARDWSLPEALLFVAPIYAVAMPLAQGFTRGVAIRTARRRTGDLFVRATLAAAFAGFVIVASKHVPPDVTGVLAVMPILMASLALVMHARVGGPATAALLANTLIGMVGMVLAFALIHLTIESIGIWAALALGLATTILWNLMLIAARRAWRARTS